MVMDDRTPSGCAQATPRTPTACPGPFSVFSARTFLVFMVLCGCAHTAPPPLPDATQGQLGTLAVVAVPAPPEVDYLTPGRGGADGAAIGTAKGLGVGIGGATVCFLTLGRALEACGMAVATPYLMAQYAVDQASEGVAADTIAASETALQAVLGAPAHAARVQAEVVRLALAHTRHRVQLMPDEGLPPVAKPIGYQHFTAQGLNTVIEITLQRVALQPRTRGHGRGDSLWRISAAELNPHLILAVTARTQVRKTADGTELYGHTRDYIGSEATFTDWGANDAQLLRENLDYLLPKMARGIIAEVFGIAPPPPPDSEVPPLRPRRRS